MRFFWGFALCAALSSCALHQQQHLHECLREEGYARGAHDASQNHPMDFSFSRSCGEPSRVDVIAAYRDGYASQRSASAGEPVVAEPAVVAAAGDAGPAMSPPANPPWVCEVEASSKIFTGVGATRDEALGSARATCGSHFQASYCTKADCKQSL